VGLRASSGGLIVADAARHLFNTTDPSQNEIEKARRKLDRMVAERRVGKVEGGTGVVSKYLPLRRGA